GMPHLADEDRELLRVVHQQAQRARAIVRDLLAAVRGRDVRRERFGVRPLIDGVLAGLRATAGAPVARVAVDVADGLPDLDADRAGIEQILVNLIQNALHAAGPAGKVTVRVTASETGITFTVEDTGPGMAPEVLPRIFEPFFTTKREGEGTGLGLFVTLGIVEAHGGTIRAENLLPPGSGARVTVVLPPGGTAEPAGTDREPEATALDGAGRVLLVDDESAIRLAVRRWFVRRGWEVVEAGDGGDALAQALAAPHGGFDLVLTDLKMPVLSGIELVDRLAVLRPDLHARVVIMTGDVASPEVAALIGRTDRPVVEKPFSFDALAEAIGRVAGSKK
ncbi:MAG TPA: hybrid sensor histidine kinase/response regulator, partial [Gemmatimonadales bacterium]|nr:hybrid sensor histidine kinase/response regulator [Gemmatimonadales bacterium]